MSSTSLNRDFGFGWSLEVFAALSCTVLLGESLRTSPKIFSSVSNWLLQYRVRCSQSTVDVCLFLVALMTTWVAVFLPSWLNLLLSSSTSPLLHKTHTTMSVVLPADFLLWIMFPVYFQNFMYLFFGVNTILEGCTVTSMGLLQHPYFLIVLMERDPNKSTENCVFRMSKEKTTTDWMLVFGNVCKCICVYFMCACKWERCWLKRLDVFLMSRQTFKWCIHFI